MSRKTVELTWRAAEKFVASNTKNFNSAHGRNYLPKGKPSNLLQNRASTVAVPIGRPGVLHINATLRTAALPSL